MAVAEQERVASVPRRRFTVDEFARMGEAGIFTEDDRVELIGGEILEMTPVGPPHAWIVNRLAELIMTRLGSGAYVSIQNPLRLGRDTEPQPDLVVARRSGAYARRHPEPGDVLLVVEAADSSLRYDRLEKIPRYGGAGVPETWLVDIAAGTVTAYTDPAAGSPWQKAPLHSTGVASRLNCGVRRSHMGRYAPSSRLVSRARRRSRCDAGLSPRAAGGYATERVLRRGDVLAATGVPALRVPVAGIFD